MAFILHLEFFFKCEWGFKESKGTFCRTDVLHCCSRLSYVKNRNLMNQNNFISYILWKKHTDFIQYLEFFLNCKIGLRESKAQFMQNWCLILLQWTLHWVKSEFWYNIDILTLTSYGKKFFFVLHLEIFLTCKLSIKGRKADFMQNWCLVLL